MSDWRNEKAWTDTFASEAERVVRLVLGELATVRIAPLRLDTQEATDMVSDRTAWGWRLRRSATTPWRDFTIRSRLPSGRTTELAKLLDGYGDFYLYSWTDERHAAQNKFSEYAVIDLSRFRERWADLEPIAETKSNKGDRNEFLCWSIAALDDMGIVPRSKMAQPSLFR